MKIELLTQKQQENQTEHEGANARMKESQNRMLLVQTNREHQALLKEIEDSKKLAKTTEERALQFIEQLEYIAIQFLSIFSCLIDLPKLPFTYRIDVFPRGICLFSESVKKS